MSQRFMKNGLIDVFIFSFPFFGFSIEGVETALYNRTTISGLNLLVKVDPLWLCQWGFLY